MHQTQLKIHLYMEPVPLAQRIARWTSNPKVLGSIPRWDEEIFFIKIVWEASIDDFNTSILREIWLVCQNLVTT